MAEEVAASRRHNNAEQYKTALTVARRDRIGNGGVGRWQRGFRWVVLVLKTVFCVLSAESVVFLVRSRGSFLFRLDAIWSTTENQHFPVEGLAVVDLQPSSKTTTDNLGLTCYHRFVFSRLDVESNSENLV